ncbi:tyrosine-type recombinase/integrase [Arthrobacter sp. NicSoilB8]|uniref:tyrosine-type recombinase/integrase n=1 Tax=Arthrobacter sp. NicSoilB8 TaxID=2830998 RepID=UPI001CC7AE76|nr:tyrosine-type recombinase/integrase [Arthrobacter sp. NicSoilB8]
MKGGNYRKLYISDELDRLYAEYVWRLCEDGLDLAVDDIDGSYVFVNIAGGRRFAPLRPETSGAPGFDAARNEELLDAVPQGLRLLHYTRDSVPAEYLGSFGFYHGKIGNIHLDGLGTTMQNEFIFAIWRIVELGGRVPCAPLALLLRELAATSERLQRAAQPFKSVMDYTPAEWRTELSTTWVRRTQQLPNSNTLRTILAPLDRISKLLWFAYDTRPWWQREIWDLTMDPRIPRRPQEMLAQVAIHWHRLQPEWLRRGTMFYVKTQIEGGDLSWSSAHGRYDWLLPFGDFVVSRDLPGPQLTPDPERLRPLMLEFLADVRQAKSRTGKNKGKPRSVGSIASITAAVRGLYAFMNDFGPEAAVAVGDERWAGIGNEYLRFWRLGDIPRNTQKHRYDERHLISDANMAALAAHAHLLSSPRSSSGLEDEQAMRILLLMMKTGRRINEICMLDLDPIIAVEGPTPEGEQIAKLRYQQTKIDDAPNTILIDQEAIAIVAEQRRWLTEHFAEDITPKYLFVRAQSNLQGVHPYQAGQFRNQLRRLVALAGLTEPDGTALDLGKTHRFRHTKATSLINGGVPLHVVQRYMGHLSPEMTMHYAQTLDATAKAEFLRVRKITASGSQPGMATDDLYELMALDSRTDRVLPNGWCTLPPAKTCDKGNACLTCNLFVTDERFLGVHEGEIVALDQLIDRRQAAHQEHTGQPMSENHVWLTLRRREQRALKTIVDSLKKQPDGAPEPLRGAGAQSRIAADRHDKEDSQ